MKSFDPISLKEMDQVALMDRMDTKYAFSFQKLLLFLDTLKGSYRVLEVNSHRTIHYESVYFDTKNFELYNDHHCGRMNRYKIRFRRYVESDLNFFEIKFKNNKNRTVKKRVTCPQMEETIQGNAEKFLNERTHLSASELEAKLNVNFSRITLVNRFSPERVTIDMDLSFKNNGTEKNIYNLVIAEVKQEKSSRSEFVKLMKSHYIYPGSMSKYCFGISSMFDQLRKNNFKPQLKRFNKILHDPATVN